jgi:hypothetical protein
VAICYDISIDIERVEDDGSVSQKTLPAKITQAGEVSPERLAELVGEFFAGFLKLIGEYDKREGITRNYAYRDTGQFTVISIFNC